METPSSAALCTYFDVNYLARGLALFGSLRKYWPTTELWVLCLDDEAYDVLVILAVPGLRPMRLAELLAHDPDLEACRGNRSTLGFYFTCTAPLMLHVLHRVPDAAVVIYLDADLFFFHDPSLLLDELAGGSILVHRHRVRKPWFPGGNGEFNVGLVAHRRDDQGLACLRHWREQCLLSCDDRPLNNRWGDQQYLDSWPARYSRLVVSQHIGAGVAPWNVADYRLRVRDRGGISADGEPLIFFHFHGLVAAGHGFVYTRVSKWPWGGRLGRVARRNVYAPYIRAVLDAAAFARGHAGISVTAFGAMARADWSSLTPVVWPRSLRDALRILVRLARGELLPLPRDKRDQDRVANAASPVAPF